MAPASETAAALLRNAHQSLPEGGLARKLELAAEEGRPLRVKLGLDPTAPDIHLGHTVVLQKLREFQDVGHRVVLIVGDYTARVGDPSGRSSTRPVLSGEEIDANAETYRRQAFTVLRDDPELLEVRRNGEWLDMRAEDLFRLARVATVAQILERDDFATRFAERRADLGARDACTRCCRATTRWRSGPTSSSAAPTRRSTCCSAATSSGPTASPSRSSSRCRSCRGSTAPRRCPSRWATTSASPSRPTSSSARRCACPTRRWTRGSTLLAVPRPPEGTGPRDAKRALARGIVERFHGADAAAAAAEQRFDRVFVTHEAPAEVDEHAFSRQRRHGARARR